jgi:hypothetical protein
MHFYQRLIDIGALEDESDHNIAWISVPPKFAIPIKGSCKSTKLVTDISELSFR